MTVLPNSQCKGAEVKAMQTFSKGVTLSPRLFVSDKNLTHFPWLSF